MCNFDVIIKNIFLDAYKVDILYNKSKLGICAKVGFRLVNLNVDFNSTLAEVGVNFVALVSELKSPSFLISMSLRIPRGNLNHKGKQPFACILDSLNKFLEVQTNEFFDALPPPCKTVDQKIEVVFRSHYIMMNYISLTEEH